MSETGNLPLINSDNKKRESKLSKLAVFSLILSFPTFYFSIFTGIPAIFYAYKSITKIRKNDGKLRGKKYAKAAIIVSLVLLGLNRVIFMDAAPIENDYTMDYFGTPDSVSLQSYITLQSLGDTDKKSSGAPSIGLSEFDLKMLNTIDNAFMEKNPDKISEQILKNMRLIGIIWLDAKKGRDTLAKLDNYPQISELSDTTLFLKVPAYTKNLKYLFTLYRQHIRLLTCRGNYEEALKELKLLDSINKKMSLGSRNIFTRIGNVQNIYIEIEAANFMINKASTPDEILLSLKPLIDSYSREHTLLSNVIVFDYLNFKKILSKVRHAPLLKYNSTLKLQRNFYEHAIAFEEKKQVQELKVWPDFYPDLPSVNMDTGGDKIYWYYKLYNPYGSFMASKIRLDMMNLVFIYMRLVNSIDMIKIILHKRLGDEENFKTIRNKNNYKFDIEKKRIYTIIADGEEFEMPINPEVLGF